MTMADDSGVNNGTTRVLRVVVLALVAGLTAFLGVAAASRARQDPQGRPGVDDPPGPRTPLPALTVAACTFAVIFVPLSLVVPGVASEAALKKVASGASDAAAAGEIASVYQVRTILGAALNAVPAHLAVVAYMIEGDPIALILSVALTLGVAARFPRRGAVEDWTAEAAAKVDLLRRAAKASG